MTSGANLKLCMNFTVACRAAEAKLNSLQLHSSSSSKHGRMRNAQKQAVVMKPDEMCASQVRHNM